MDSVDQEFWQGTASMASVCTIMPRPQLGRSDWLRVTNWGCSGTITMQHSVLIFLCKTAQIFIKLTDSAYWEFKDGTTAGKTQMAKE